MKTFFLTHSNSIPIDLFSPFLSFAVAVVYSHGHLCLNLCNSRCHCPSGLFNVVVLAALV